MSSNMHIKILRFLICLFLMEIIKFIISSIIEAINNISGKKKHCTIQKDNVGRINRYKIY